MRYCYHRFRPHGGEKIRGDSRGNFESDEDDKNNREIIEISMTEKYFELNNLQVYQSALEISNESWIIYERFTWQIKKVIGDQFITAIDSVGANIAEGYGRYHYLDKIKFYYNSRGSLLEAKHWLILLFNRKLISQKEYDEMSLKLDKLHQNLNNFIRACYPKK